MDVDKQRFWRPAPVPSLNLAHMDTASISLEAIASIVFGILQLTIGLVALWQQRQLRQLHRQYIQRSSVSQQLTLCFRVQV